MNEVLSYAEKKDFENFSKKIKEVLEDKLRSNIKLKSNNDKVEKYNSIMDTFKEISKRRKI